MSLELLSRLWSNARQALTRLRASIPPLDTLDRKERRKLGRWIAALEAFVGRIVLLQALHLTERGSPLSAKARREGAQARPKTHARLGTRAPKRRPPRLRLWPQSKRTGPRIRLLGPPTAVAEIWRDQRRDALIARLKAALGRRRRPHIVLADRLDAIDSILDEPMRAARRLARKLARAPRLAMTLAFKPTRLVPGIDDSIPHEAHSAEIGPALALNSS